MSTEQTMNPGDSAPTADSAASSTSRTLEKGLRLLGLFDAEHQQWSPRELREATGESKTTVLRLTKTLEVLAIWHEMGVPASCVSARAF
jgi:hypothetical protein